MSCLSFRIGCSTSNFSDDWFMKVLYHVARKGPVYAVKEVSQKSGHHIHVLVETDMVKKSFSQFMKNKYPELNKGNWSVKNEPQKGDALEKAKCYLSKGEKPTSVEDRESWDADRGPLWKVEKHLPTVFMNTLGVEVEKYYDKYWETFSEKEALNVPVVVIPTFVQRVYMDLEAQQHNWDMDDENQEKVLRYVLKCLGEKGKSFDDTIIRRLLYGIWNLLNHDEFVSRTIRRGDTFFHI